VRGFLEGAALVAPELLRTSDAVTKKVRREEE